MEAPQRELQDLVQRRLFNSISNQIDMIAFVPEDLRRLAGMAGKGLEGAAPLHPDGSLADPLNGKGLSEDDPATLIHRINAHYDRVFYAQDGIERLILEGAEFKNLGYWDETTQDLNTAGENLFKALMSMIPEHRGRILDAGCGTGAATRRLLNYYRPENVWAINISAKQIESTRHNAPGCNAQVMSAVDMTFESEFFDNILSIEAALHFETRRRFLEESFRVLKKGGHLALSDILFTSRDRLEQNAHFGSASNHVSSLEEYKALLEEVGFREVVVQDVSKQVWGANFLYNIKKLHREWFHGRISLMELTETLWSFYYVNSIFSVCLFACGRK